MQWILAVFLLSISSFATDFRVYQTSDRSIEFENNLDCKAQIASSICLVDPEPDDVERDPLKRPCLSGGDRYVEIFQKLYDEYPAPISKVFCSIRRIFIEKNFFGTAYGGLLESDGKQVGAMIGIRKSALDESLSLTRWASWKDQLNFGGSPKGYNLKASLPRAIVNLESPVQNDFLFFVIAHEFGHVIDFSNRINNFTEQKIPVSGSWSELSWRLVDKPLASFYGLQDLCFYSCKKAIGYDSMPLLYSEFSNVNFLSLYTATNPYDDFADSLAYFLMFEQLGMRYEVVLNGQTVNNVREKFYSKLFQSKRNYIAEFLVSGKINYP